MTEFVPFDRDPSDYDKGKRQGFFEGFWVATIIIGFLWLAWVCLPYAGGQ